MGRLRNLLLLGCLPVAIAIGLAAPVRGEVLIFEGRVEAARQAEVYSRAEGIVAEILVTEGDQVSAGQVLVRLRSDLAQLGVTAAEASLDRSEALLAQARARLARAERLSQSGSGSEVATNEARTNMLLAEADLRQTRGALEAARIHLADTDIRAPIDGYVDSPQVRLGALLEFSSGDPPLFTLVQLDTVQLVYEVPYGERLTQMSRTGAPDAQSLLQSVRLEVATATGEVLATDVIPTATGVTVDDARGTLEVRAMIANPDVLLRPGQTVTVRSRVGATSAELGSQ